MQMNLNLIKISSIIYFSIFVLFITLFSYTPNNVKNKLIYSCVKIAKENCSFNNKRKAKLVFEQCKVFVRHKQDLNQIKNSYHCKKKKD